MITELRARVEKATGANIMIDGLLYLAIVHPEATDIHDDGAGLRFKTPREGMRHVSWRDIKPYSASIDAAVGLIDRVLPGWEISLRLHASEAFADVDEDPGDPKAGCGHASSSAEAITACEMGDCSRETLGALALLSAMLAALEAKEAG